MEITAQKIDKIQMKRLNRQLIFTEIHCQGAVSRARLAELSGLSSMSVGRIADELIQSALVTEEEKKGDGSLGRRPRLLQIAADSLMSLGIELDRSRMAAGVVDFKGRVLKKLEVFEDLAAQTPKETATLAASLLHKLTRDYPEKTFRLCGVASPGIIESESGVMRFSSQLQWKDVPFADLLCRAAPFLEAAVMDNELKARAQAEVLFGQDQTRQRVAVLNFGSGVGSALIIGRQLYRGRANMAGEIGHVCIDPNGGLCECGKRGCLQTYLTDVAMLGDAQRFAPGITLDGLFEAHRQEAPWAINIIEYVARYAILAISMLDNLYAPDTVILCGSLIERYKALSEAVLREYQTRPGQYGQNPLTLKISTLGSDGNLVGAGTLAFYKQLDMFA